MWEFYPLGTHFREPKMFAARWAGAGAAVPTPVTNVKDSQPTKSTITRSGVGALVVTVIDTPLGVIQNYDFWIASNNVADRNVRVSPPALGTATFTLNVTFSANGVACDVAAGEELLAMIMFAQAP